jgi:hypothetical protein
MLTKVRGDGDFPTSRTQTAGTSAWRHTCSDTRVAFGRTLQTRASLTLPGSETRALAIVALFVAIQAADFVLTLNGLSRFGIDMEANPLLAASIRMCGAGVTLLTAKMIAIGLATMLNAVRAHLALAILTVLYVFAALVPWSLTLAV